MLFSTLSIVRRQHVYLNRRLVLDFESPFEVDDTQLEAAITDLEKLMTDYQTILSTQERQPQNHRYGAFRTGTIISVGQNPKSAPRLMQIVEMYMKAALQQKEAGALFEDAFEIGSDDEPTQHVIIQSWWEFTMKGTNEEGSSIELTMDHPVTWSRERKPIEDVKSFLSSVWARHLGERSSLVEEFKEAYQLQQRDFPEQPLSEFWRTRELANPYRPIGCGYDFPGARVAVTAATYHPPVESDVSEFLEHFLERVAYTVPQLCL